LDAVLHVFADQTHVNFFVDRAALTAANLLPKDDFFSLSFNPRPATVALQQLLEPCALDHQISADLDVVIITTRETTRRQLATRVYPLPDEPEDLMNTLVTGIVPESWVGSGGSGTIAVFEAKRLLIVRQTADVQRMIDARLAELSQ
ncbi:MAG: hypothetical protein B7Z55_08715, partial [Planctomycetales bacterium 12-60-4]